MALLTDEQLVVRVRGGLVTGLIPPADWFAAESPVQPASVDLHIGKIYVPGASSGSPGSQAHPLTSICLESGQSAVIATREQVNLPDDIAAFAFAPFDLAIGGLLLTNPGHIAPGYQGFLHLTVINLSKDAYALAAPGEILKVLFFQLSTPVKKGHRDRNPTGGSDALAMALSKLPPTFLDIEQRAQVVARRVVEEQSNRLQLWSRMLTALCAVILIGIFSGVIAIAWNGVAVEAKQQSLEERLRSQDSEQKLRGDIELLRRTVEAMTLDARARLGNRHAERAHRAIDSAQTQPASPGGAQTQAGSGAVRQAQPTTNPGTQP
jgi:deoxycytidine triphosphate deaminase